MDRFIGLFYIFSWVSGYLWRLSPGIPFLPLDLAALLLVMSRRPAMSSFLKRRVGMTGMVFLFTWLLSLRLITPQDALFGLIYLARTMMYLIAFSWSRNAYRTIRGWISAGMYSFVGLGLLQYFLIPDTRFLLKYGWDEHYFRLIGTVLDPNYEGILLGIIAIFSLFRLQKSRQQSWMLLFLFSLAALVFTYSRASWVATAIGFVILLIKIPLNPKKKLTFACVVVAMLFTAFAIAPKPGGEGVKLERTVSISHRIDSWNEALHIWKQHPFFGIGFNNYKSIRMNNGILEDSANHAANAPSNSWLLVLATTGVVGVFALFAIGFPLLIRVSANPLWLSLVTAIGVHALFNNTLFYTPVWGLLILIRASTER